MLFSLIQAKLAARRQRRQQEAKRKGQEEAAQKILEEQSHLAVNSKTTTAEHIVIPNVIAGQSPEEMVCISTLTSRPFFFETPKHQPGYFFILFTFQVRFLS